MADIRIDSVVLDHVDGGTYTLPQPVPDLGSAFVRMLSGGTRPAGSGPTGTTGNTNTDHASALELTDRLTVTGHVIANNQVRSIGEVWSYTGPVGGPYEFLVLWSGVIDITDSLVVQPIPGVVDKDRLVPFVGGITYTQNALEWNDACVTAWINGDGDLIVSRGPGKSGTTRVYVSVVDFRGSEWTVAHARSTDHDQADEPVTMMTGSDGHTGTVFTVDDWSKAFLVGYMEGDAGGEEGLSDTLAIWRPDTTTTVLFDLHQDGNARNDAPAHCHIVHCPDLEVHRFQSSNWTEGNGTWTPLGWPAGASTVAAVESLAAEWFCDTSGVGTAHMRGAVGPRINAAGDAEAWVHRQGNTVAVQFGVIDFTACFAIAPRDVTVDPYHMAEHDAAGNVVRVVIAPDPDWPAFVLGGGPWVETRNPDAVQPPAAEYAGPGYGYGPNLVETFALPWNQAKATVPNDDGAWWYTNGADDVVYWPLVNGVLWRNTLPVGSVNSWEPGVANWRQTEDNAPWVQPTGAFDAYRLGEQCTHVAATWRSFRDFNTREPGTQDSGWEQVT